jgi:hypothetical protein
MIPRSIKIAGAEEGKGERDIWEGRGGEGRGTHRSFALYG